MTAAAYRRRWPAVSCQRVLALEFITRSENARRLRQSSKSSGGGKIENELGELIFRPPERRRRTSGNDQACRFGPALTAYGEYVLPKLKGVDSSSGGQYTE